MIRKTIANNNCEAPHKAKIPTIISPPSIFKSIVAIDSAPPSGAKK